MRYFLGVDGGGSKTLATILSEDGKEVGFGISGSVDVLNETKEEFKNHLFSAVHEALRKADLNVKSISFACFGMPAVGDVEGIEEEITPLIKELNVPNFIVVNDVRAALEGAFPFKQGAILLAGTGAMVMAKDENEMVFRVDGWGENVGDLGSGYFIGQLALREAFEEYDGRSEQTPFLKKVKEFAGVSDLKKILLNCKGSNVRRYIASFSKVVCEAEKSNIYPAREILNEAIKELLKSVKALKNIMKVEKSIPLSVVGGVFNCDYMKKEFEKRLDGVEWIKVSEKEFSPHVGAALMAAKRILNKNEMEELYQRLGGKVK